MLINFIFFSDKWSKSHFKGVNPVRLAKRKNKTKTSGNFGIKSFTGNPCKEVILSLSARNYTEYFHVNVLGKSSNGTLG